MVFVCFTRVSTILSSVGSPDNSDCYSQARMRCLHTCLFILTYRCTGLHLFESAAGAALWVIACGSPISLAPYSGELGALFGASDTNPRVIRPNRESDTRWSHIIIPSHPNSLPSCPPPSASIHLHSSSLPLASQLAFPSPMVRTMIAYIRNNELVFLWLSHLFPRWAAQGVLSWLLSPPQALLS